MNILDVKNISHSFDQKSLGQFTNISFSLKKGEVLTLLGPSGTGKTTLFNLLLNEIPVESGSIEFNGDATIEMVSSLDDLNWERTVFENIEDHLLKSDPSADTNRVRDMIEIFGLEYKDHKMLSELSAGQLQRLLFARSMVINPSILLLDEPFSNIDEFLKATLCGELFEIFKDRGISLIFVTHNLREAYSLSDRIIFLNGAKMQTYENPNDFYMRPQSIESARFGGLINLLASSVTETNGELLTIKNDFGSFEVDNTLESSNRFVYLAIRPKYLKIVDTGGTKGRISKISNLGDIFILDISSANSKSYKVQVNDLQDLRIGQQVRMSIELDKSFLLPV